MAGFHLFSLSVYHDCFGVLIFLNSILASFFVCVRTNLRPFPSPVYTDDVIFPQSLLIVKLEARRLSDASDKFDRR